MQVCKRVQKSTHGRKKELLRTLSKLAKKKPGWKTTRFGNSQREPFVFVALFLSMLMLVQYEPNPCDGANWGLVGCSLLLQVFRLFFFLCYQEWPDLIIPEKGLLHKSPTNRFINFPLYVNSALFLWGGGGKQTNPQRTEDPHGVYKPVRGRDVNRPQIHHLSFSTPKIPSTLGVCQSDYIWRENVYARCPKALEKHSVGHFPARALGHSGIARLVYWNRIARSQKISCSPLPGYFSACVLRGSL